MVDLQEVFNRIRDTKKKQKDIRSSYKEALQSSSGYKQVLEDIKNLQVKKKQIEQAVREQFGSELEQLEAFTTNIKSDETLLSDAALTMLMKGERVEVQDENHVLYDPVFSVKFKKAS